MPHDPNTCPLGHTHPNSYPADECPLDHGACEAPCCDDCPCGAEEEPEEWTYEGYWVAVLGERSPSGVVSEFDLVAEGLNEWLGIAESVSWSQEGQGGTVPQEWGEYHELALNELRKEIENRCDGGCGKDVMACVCPDERLPCPDCYDDNCDGSCPAG